MVHIRLKDILTPKIISVSPSSSFADALAMLGEHKISCIPVLQNGEPVGIVTERSVVQLAAAQEDAFSDCSVGDIMTSPVITASKDLDIYSAYDFLINNAIRHLVVVDDKNQMCGVVTQSNIMDHLGYEYFIEFKRIAQIMTRTPVTIQKHITVHQALQKMAGIAASCLIVCEDERPIGILTERDMTRLLLEGKASNQLTMESVMSQPVCTTPFNLPLLDAAKTMKEKKIRRIVVVDDEGKLAGLTTQTDIIKGLQGQHIKNLKQLVIEKDKELESTSKKLAEKTVYLDNILHSSVDMGMVAASLDFRIIYFNPAAEKILGVPANQILGHNIRDIHARYNITGDHFDKTMSRIRKSEKFEFTFIHDNEQGKRFIKAMVTGIWDPDQQLVGFVFMVQDVTQATAAEQQIKKQQEDLEFRNTELSALFTVTSKITRTLDLSFLLDEVLRVVTAIEIFKFGQQGGIFIVNEQSLELVSQVGLSNDCLQRMHVLEIDNTLFGRPVQTGDIIAADLAELHAANLGCDEDLLHGLVAVPLNSKGKVVGVLFLYTPENFVELSQEKMDLLYAIGGQVGIAIENAKLYEETKRLSLYDPMTKVANRRFMDIRLENHFVSAKRYEKPFSIIMLDVDNFKLYNDTFGHSAGDKVLIKIGEVLLQDIRDADTVARYGGEEFLVMLPETTLTQACISAERIRRAIEVETDTTVSMGLATFSLDMTRKEDLVSKADQALYRAKGKGKNRVEY